MGKVRQISIEHTRAASVFAEHQQHFIHQSRVAITRVAQISALLGHRKIGRSLKEGLNSIPACLIHCGQRARTIWDASHAFAVRHSRSAVDSETSSNAAV